MDSITYRVTWWPTDGAPKGIAREGANLKIKRTYTDVQIIEGETTFEDIRKIIAVRRTGRPDDAQYVHVFAAIQIDGEM